MTPNSMVKKINYVFEQANGSDIDWSARPSHLAAYIAAAHVEVGLAYDFSPATDDSQLAANFWAVYDAIYRTMLSLDYVGSWTRIRFALAIGEFDRVRADLANVAMEVALAS